MTLDSLRHQILEAREARAATIARLSAPISPGHALVFLSLNVPGPGKTSPRLDRVFERARSFADAALRGREADAVATEEDGRDALGPWLARVSAGEAGDIKRRCIALEERLPAGRLIDLDVYDRLGRQIDRASLGLPPRRCLVCAEPAIDCMRAQRHSVDELAEAVARLLHDHEMASLADALLEGARIELALTPKPGLVDRRDNGSHPDLSFELMERSIALLPEYYEELIQLTADTGLEPRATTPRETNTGLKPRATTPAELQACIEAGRRAEERMLASIGTNAHRGYIFLSGLVLLAAGSRAAIQEIAERIVAARPSMGPSHGDSARARHGIGGILGEALKGLPSVFEHALPALERAEARFGPSDAARHAAMATLMTVVEDTTTLHRCGAEGLERLRHDGHRLLDAIESGGNYVGLLERLNDEYRAAGMTMGGVADLLAITIALAGRI